MKVPVAEGLFTMPIDGTAPQLRASVCGPCGAVDFPARTRCSRCGVEDVADTLLSTTGTLWTWTTQEFRPPSPPYTGDDTTETFTPFAVGYVELPDGIRIETRLVGTEVADPVIGEPWRLVLVPFRVDGAGDEVVTFAFEKDTTGAVAA